MPDAQRFARALARHVVPPQPALDDGGLQVQVGQAADAPAPLAQHPQRVDAPQRALQVAVPDREADARAFGDDRDLAQGFGFDARVARVERIELRHAVAHRFGFAALHMQLELLQQAVGEHAVQAEALRVVFHLLQVGEGVERAAGHVAGARQHQHHAHHRVGNRHALQHVEPFLDEACRGGRVVQFVEHLGQQAGRHAGRVDTAAVALVGVEQHVAEDAFGLDHLAFDHMREPHEAAADECAERCAVQHLAFDQRRFLVELDAARALVLAAVDVEPAQDVAAPGPRDPVGAVGRVLQLGQDCHRAERVVALHREQAAQQREAVAHGRRGVGQVDLQLCDGARALGEPALVHLSPGHPQPQARALAQQFGRQQAHETHQLPQLAAHEQLARAGFDQPRGGLGLAGQHRVAHGVVVHGVAREPVPGRHVHAAALVGRPGLEARAQHVTQQRMNAPPGGRIVRAATARHEQPFAREPAQQCRAARRRGGRLAEQGRAQRRVEARRHGAAHHQPQLVRCQSRQHLVLEVGRKSLGIAHALDLLRQRARPTAQRHAQQLQAGGPAVGQRMQAIGDALVGARQPTAQEAGRLVARKAQVVGAELQHLVGGARPCEK
ncbi:hypothetical protein D9M72_327250 [compost metagenome]